MKIRNSRLFKTGKRSGEGEWRVSRDRPVGRSSQVVSGPDFWMIPNVPGMPEGKITCNNMGR